MHPRISRQKDVKCPLHFALHAFTFPFNVYSFHSHRYCTDNGTCEETEQSMCDGGKKKSPNELAITRRGYYPYECNLT